MDKYTQNNSEAIAHFQTPSQEISLNDPIIFSFQTTLFLAYIKGISKCSKISMYNQEKQRSCI